MWPSDILDELRAERDRVLEVVAEVHGALATPSISPHDLRQRLLVLRFAILSYTDLEDELLPEILRTMDAWGEAHLEAMGREHLRRRAVLARALAETETMPEDADADRVRDVTLLLRELDAEMVRALTAEELELFDGAARRDEARRFDGTSG